MRTTRTGSPVERSKDGGAFAELTILAASSGTGKTVTYTDTTVATSSATYAYRVRSLRLAVPSPYSNTATVSVVAAPAAPSNFAGVTSVCLLGLAAQVNLSWTDNSNNETRFVIQRATNASFTNGLTTTNVNGNNATTPQLLTRSETTPRRTTFYYRIRAENGGGTSVWVNLNPFPIVTALFRTAFPASVLG